MCSPRRLKPAQRESSCHRHGSLDPVQYRYKCCPVLAETHSAFLIVPCGGAHACSRHPHTPRGLLLLTADRRECYGAWSKGQPLPRTDCTCFSTKTCASHFQCLPVGASLAQAYAICSRVSACSRLLPTACAPNAILRGENLHTLRSVAANHVWSS